MDNLIGHKPQVVTICGSMRFSDWMLEIAENESYEGVIILMPFVTIEPDSQPTSEEKLALDLLHLQKINMSNSIIVATDKDMYRGESTRREIDYAMAHDKPVRYMFKTEEGLICTVIVGDEEESEEHHESIDDAWVVKLVKEGDK